MYLSWKRNHHWLHTSPTSGNGTRSLSLNISAGRTKLRAGSVAMWWSGPGESQEPGGAPPSVLRGQTGSGLAAAFQAPSRRHCPGHPGRRVLQGPWGKQVRPSCWLVRDGVCSGPTSPRGGGWTWHLLGSQSSYFMPGLMTTGHRAASKRRMRAELGHSCHQSRAPVGSSHLRPPAHLPMTHYHTHTLPRHTRKRCAPTPCTQTARVCQQAHTHSTHMGNKMNTLKCSFLNTSEAHMHSSLLLSFDGFQNKKVYKVVNGEWLSDHGTFWSYSTNTTRGERWMKIFRVSLNRRMDKQNVVHPHNECCQPERKAVLTQATAWMDSEDIMLRDIRQTWKNKWYLCPLIQGT